MKAMRTRKSSLSLAFYQDAIVHFYAEKYQREYVDILRSIITHYSRADSRFDPEEFQRFVKERYPKILGSFDISVDKNITEEIDRQTKIFLGNRYNPNMGTATLVGEVHKKTRKTSK